MDARRLLSEVPPGAAMLACGCATSRAFGCRGRAVEGVWGWSWCNDGHLRPVYIAGGVQSFRPTLRPTTTWEFEGFMEQEIS
jgi:hypothetical protein